MKFITEMTIEDHIIMTNHINIQKNIEITKYFIFVLILIIIWSKKVYDEYEEGYISSPVFTEDIWRKVPETHDKAVSAEWHDWLIFFCYRN